MYSHVTEVNISSLTYSARRKVRNHLCTPASPVQFYQNLVRCVVSIWSSTCHFNLLFKRESEAVSSLCVRCQLIGGRLKERHVISILIQRDELSFEWFDKNDN